MKMTGAQIILDGFLGFTPTADGFRINPVLPRDWPELTVSRIRLHDTILNIRTTTKLIEVNIQSNKYIKTN